MNTLIESGATIADLMRVEGKAELIAGRIVRQMPAGRRHGRIALWIAMALEEFAKKSGGEAFADNMTFAVEVPSTGRRSFSPDVAYYVGLLGALEDEPGPVYDAPTLAVEIRSPEDYGPVADERLAAKRAEYFEAGTLVVWDVDPAAKTVYCHSAMAPDQPREFVVGQTADAEPAVPGWRITVETIFAR